jgi:Ca-activated chloride channel homolog
VATGVNISFDAPWALALLLVLPIIWMVAARTRTNLSRKHLVTVATLRSLALAFLAFALSQPVWHGSTSEISVVYALDVSRSVASDFVDDALLWIEAAQREQQPAQSNIVVFAKQSAVVRDTDGARALTVIDGAVAGGAEAAPSSINQAATDLEAALDESLGALSRDRVKRIVLLSDGNETSGTVANVLPRLKTAGVRVFAVPARPYAAGDVWIDGIDVPDRLRSNEPVSIAVRVFSPVETRAQVSLSSGGRLLARRTTKLAAGINSVAFDTRMPSPGAVSLSAQVRAEGDSIQDNDRMQISTWVGEKAKVLYLEGQKDTSKFLADALRKEGLDVDVIGLGRVPRTARGLLSYDAIILSDLPAKSLPPEMMQAVESYVRDYGGGLVFASGENTFGEDGYSGSALEKVLPVEFKAQEKRKDIALVIAIDRSYSMKGRKMEYAKEAARAALDLLEEQHHFAVVAFDSQPYVSVPMHQVRSKRKAEAQISRIQASGQTNIYPALGVVYRMLQKVDARTKHVILLSDGDTHPADFERLIARMREQDIVVSTVTIGEGGNPGLMQDIAAWGKGRNYMAANAESIPQIFTEETRKIVGANLVEEAILPVVKQRLHALSGVDFADAPALGGHVSVKARDTAEVYLATQQGAPLLTRWQYGLGKSIMFSSDVKNRWSAGWVEWKNYGKFWAQLVRDTMRQGGSESVVFSLRRDGSDAVIRLMLLTEDGQFRDELSPEVAVSRGDEGDELIKLHQLGPGVYQARAPFGSAATLSARVRNGGGIDSATAERAGVRTIFSGFPDEYRSLPPNLDLLQTIANETGGKVGPSIEEVFATQGDQGKRSSPLWPWLAIAALFTYLVDILLRRLPYAWRRLGS